MKKFALAATVLLSTSQLFAQQIKIGDNAGAVTFEEYEPKSTLVVPGKVITRAKFPFIDIHNHQWEMNGKEDLNKLITDMDKMNMGLMVNLSGRGFNQDEARSTAGLVKQLESVKTYYPTRFAIFTNIDFSNINEPGWTAKAVKTLEDDVKLRGAKGLKIYKSLGFNVKDNGKVVPVDDPRIDPIWKKAGELGIPVLIHTADPASFWDPLNAQNERWLELKTHPGRKRDASNGKEFTWEQLIEQQHNVFRKNPKTIFINAHMGWYPNNLAKLDSLMDAFPNMYAEIGAVIAELGRQPRTAKKFFEKRQDRILFGKDSWVPDEYQTYFRVLESEDEYFPYHKKYHAYWRMYGLGLSDEVLKKVYYKNALKIVPGLDKSQFPK